MIMVESTDKKVGLDQWECSPGKFVWEYENDERVLIFDGEVVVTEEDGTVYNLNADDAAYFPKGTKATWEITKTIRKAFVAIT